MAQIINAETVIKIDSLSEVSEDFEAAKQLRAELSMIKGRVLMSGTAMNSILIMQLRMVLRGLMKKYHEAGLLKDENVTLVLKGRGRHASFNFGYSQNLHQLIQAVENQALEELKKKQAETKKEETDE